MVELNTKERGAKIWPFSIMVATAGFNCRGCELWAKASKQEPLDADTKTWGNIILSPDFGRYMEENRLKEYWKVTATIGKTTIQKRLTHDGNSVQLLKSSTNRVAN